MELHIADQRSRPTIPASEYAERWSRVQATMAALDLDFLVAYADDRASFGPAHARWLANFPVHFEPVCLLMPRHGEPVMLVGPETDQYARLAGRVADVRILRELTHPDEDYPYSRIQSLAQVIAEIGGASAARRIGLGGGGLIGSDIMSALRIALPSAQWVDVENDLCELRSQKSTAELEVIRHAYLIAEAGISAGIETVSAGVTEREVAAEIESAMRRAGAEGTGIDTIVASGPNSRPVLARSTFRHIERDDLVLLTVAPRYEGYHAAIGRVVLVGDPGLVVRSSLNSAIQAQHAAAGALGPGREGRRVEAVARGIMEGAGLGQYFLYSGLHSVGVIEFEPPIFGPGSPAILKENMVISIDVPVFNAPWGGIRIEDGYVITATGAEPLSRTPYEIQK